MLAADMKLPDAAEVWLFSESENVSEPPGKLAASDEPITNNDTLFFIF